MIMKPVTKGQGAAIQKIEAEAAVMVRENSFKTTSGVYVPSERRGLTREQAFAAAMESRPELYADYRRQHNAAAIVAQLEAAGITIR
jgi:hypothetical protein